MRAILFNGKFLAAHPTGVHRVAEEIIRAVDNRISAGAQINAAVLHPKDVLRRLPLKNIPHRQIGSLTWQPWEQADLPRLAGPGVLVNLCNLGPVLRRNAVTMIHDAQVCETPASYSPAFRTYYKAIQPVLARRHRAILTVSDYARDALIRFGVATDAHVITNGCDHVHRTVVNPAASATLGLQRGRYVLAQASAQKHKNVRVLLEAFHSPRLSGLTLALFGAADISTFTADLSPNVRLLGRLSDEMLFGLMTDAAAFACPSRTEGFGLPPAEAMAMGCPVVAAPCGALPEVCGDAALYAHPDHPAEWVEALSSIANRPDLRRDLIHRGQSQTSTMTWDRAAVSLLDFLATLDGTNPCAA